MRRFKCFDALELPCAPLTVLTGYNAAGKSTALHSILLMAQALRSNPRSDRLVLNGSLVALGSGGDVLRHGTKTLRLGARRPGEEALWTFGHDRNLSYRGLMPLVAVKYTRDGELYESYDKLFPDAIPSGAALLTALRDTIFLGADRAVHLETYPVPRSPWQVAGNVGSRGEYAPYWYLEYDEAVVPERRHRRERDKRESVHIQSEAWLGELFPGARTQAKRLSPDSPVELSFRLGTQGSWARPPNIGFGLGTPSR